MANDFDLFGEDTKEPDLDFVGEERKPSVSPEEAFDKANRYNFALGDLTSGTADIYQSIITGQENILTQRMMELERGREFQRRQERLVQFTNQANDKGLPLSEEEYNNIVTRPAAQVDDLLRNPETYFAKKQAQKMIDDVWNSVSKQEDVPEMDDFMRRHLTKQYKVHELLKDYTKRLDELSPFSKGINIAEQFVPVFSWWNQTDALKNAPTSSWLRGTNIREQVDYFWGKGDPDEAMTELSAAVSEMFDANPYDAVAFLNAMISYGESDEGTDNAMQAFELATGITAGVGFSAGRSAIKAFTRQAGSPRTTVPGVVDATGNVADASFRTVVARAREAADVNSGAAVNPPNLVRNLPVSSFDEIAQDIPSIFNPDAVKHVGSQRFGSTFLNNLTDTLKNQAGALINLGLDSIRVSRLEPGTQAYNVALQETQRLFADQFPSTNGAVVNIRPVTSAVNNLTNTDHIAIALGRTDGTLFPSEDIARANAGLYELTDYTIQRRGKEYYIEVTKAVDETLPSVRDALAIDTVNRPTPATLVNSVIGRLRTKDDLLPENLARDLKISGYGAQQFANLFAGIASRSLTPLRKQSRQRLHDFLDSLRDETNPKTKKNGVWAENIHDFEVMWKKRFNELPTDDETTAYMTMKQLSDAEYFFNNLNIYKGKSRLGFEMFHFEKVGVRPKVGPQIEGRMVDLERLYAHKEDANILVWDNSRNGQPGYVRKNALTQEARDDIARLVNEEGYRLVQLSRYGQDALSQYPAVRLPDAPIDYVLVQNFSSRPLPLKQIPYRGGPHVQYATRHFVSQPDIATYNTRGTDVNYYRGDKNFFGFESSQQAARYTEALERGRLMYREYRNTRDDFRLREFLKGNRSLPYTFDEFVRHFENGTFNADRPFMARARGQSLHSQHKLDGIYANFVDSIGSPHNPMNEDVALRFAQERDDDLMSIINNGSANDPILQLTRARRIDPYVTMSRAIRNVASARYLDDLRIKAAERFVREFREVFTGSQDELTQYPMRALDVDKIDRNHPNKQLVAAARNYRRSLIEFLNIKDPDGHDVDSIVDYAANLIFRDGGTSKSQKRFERIEPFLMSTVRDPSRFFRAVGFHPTMGFFNIKQFFMQAQGVVNAIAIEGLERGTKGGALGSLMQPLHMRANDDTLIAAANIANKLVGIDPEHFKESYLALQRTGFQNVGGEYGTLDDFLNPTIMGGAGSKMLDKGLIFFRKGEQLNRLTAWNAAYLRWRQANPLAAFNDSAVKEVLNRADLITINMSRASNASFNQGWASVPTQFVSYQARLMDLMLGRRLEPWEKARLALTYSALYGVPTAAAGATLGALWPMQEQARKWVMEAGYDVNETGWNAFLNGLPQATIAWVTGGEVNPNIGQTFGPGGLSWISEIFSGERSAAEIALGPSGRVAQNLWDTFYRVAEAGYGRHEPLMSAMTGSTSESKYLPLTATDFQPLLSIFSSLNNTQKAYFAANLGTYFTKNNIDVIGDNFDNPWNALFTGIVGTVPQKVSDFYLGLDIKKDIEDGQRRFRQEASKYFKMAIDVNISDQDRLLYLKKAKAAAVAGGLTLSQQSNMQRQALREMGQTAIEELDEELKNANQERQERWFKTLRGEE